ncbi:MAG TPA: hypothetical protein DIW47_12730 [Bacteroidetes bacterium]|nr:hypothetical protein [Bacteroidota bacterium]
MRNTTKLKFILYKYTVSFDLEDDSLFTMTLIDKDNGEGVEFQAKSYSTVISKAYSHLLRELKKEEKGIDR